jgi:aquaporin related protein
VYWYAGAKALVGLHDITDNRNIWRMLSAEFLGTFFLVLVGCSSITPWENSSSVIQIAFTFGLAVATIAQVSRHCVPKCGVIPIIISSAVIRFEVSMAMKTVRPEDVGSKVVSVLNPRPRHEGMYLLLN